MGSPLNYWQLRSIRRTLLASARPHRGSDACPVCLDERAPQKSFCAKDDRHGLCDPCMMSIVAAAGKEVKPPRCPMCRDVLAGVPRLPAAVANDDGRLVPGELLEDNYMCCLYIHAQESLAFRSSVISRAQAARRALQHDATLLIGEDDGMQESEDILHQGSILTLLFITGFDTFIQVIEAGFRRLSAWAAHEALLRFLQKALAGGGEVSRYEVPCFSYNKGELSPHPPLVRYEWADAEAAPLWLNIFTSREHEGSAVFRPYYTMSP